MEKVLQKLQVEAHMVTHYQVQFEVGIRNGILEKVD